MRILYLDHPGPDYMAALLFRGLCEEVGWESVEDYPWKALYHGLPFVDGGVTNLPFPWMQNIGRLWTRGPYGSEAELTEQIGAFDLVVLASPREVNTAVLQRIIDRAGRGALRRFVMVDGEDYTTVRWDLVERFSPDVYFKYSAVPPENVFDVYHDLKARLAPTTRVVPFPLASTTGVLEEALKDIDVSFLGGTHWKPAALRREGVTWAGQLPAEYVAALDTRLREEFSSYVGPSAVALPHVDFVQLLNRSRIAVCVGGHGIGSLRSNEILSCPGTLLMMERVPVLAPHPVIEGTHCAAFGVGDGFDHEELVRGIRYYLDHEEGRRRIADAGHVLLKEHYTSRARAKQLLSEVGLGGGEG